MPNPVRKTVVVTGDLIWDYNLARHPVAPVAHHAPPRSTVLQECAGGAWFLTRVLEAACGPAAEVRGVKPPPPEGPARKSRAAKAYQIWTHFPTSLRKKRGGSTWRMSRLLGCQSPDHESTEAELPEDDLPSPDVLVLDDQCLGFRDSEDQWPAALRAGGSPGSVVLKTSSPGFDNPLWRRLLQGGLAGRLTIVLTAEVLRERGAALSRGLSWDQTIEELDDEFGGGASSRDLATCRRVVVLLGASGIASFSRCDQPFGSPAKDARNEGTCTYDRVRFERLAYDSDDHEGTWWPGRPGYMLGGLSLVTAAIVRHECEPDRFPIPLACGRGLAAVRTNHLVGGGTDQQLDDEAGARAGMDVLAADPVASDGGTSADPADRFFFAYPQYTDDFAFGFPVTPAQIAARGRRCDILRDVTGAGEEYMIAKATQIVLEGPENALRPAPEARYGYFLSVDREEITRINAIHNLLIRYRENDEDGRPMSIAVFGRPGSGKSFAVKQLLSTVFRGEKALEFNLSQFTTEEDLHSAFHQVRDRTVHGAVPLVFWDEFDAENLRWLKEFLAPMQDAEFRSGGLVHPFGRSIFVFAGGTKHTFEDFARTGVEGEEWVRFCEQKGPDFVSRLRGYVNIKGPNPVWLPGCAEDPATEERPDKPGDLTHYIRRAIVLRVSLQRNCPEIVDAQGRAHIDASVVGGFLRVREYKHGARSIVSLVSMSRPGRRGHFGPASLPPPHLLKLHVSDDFSEHVRRGQLGMPLVELLAEACHQAWLDMMTKQGYVQGSPRDDTSVPPKHPQLMPYVELPEEWKEENRRSARVVHAKLAECGLAVRAAGAAPPAGTSTVVPYEDLGAFRDRLVAAEHGIWLRDRLIRGYSYADVTDDASRTHTDIALFADVPETHKVYNTEIVKSVFATLEANGYVVVKEGS